MNVSYHAPCDLPRSIDGSLTISLVGFDDERVIFERIRRLARGSTTWIRCARVSKERASPVLAYPSPSPRTPVSP